MIFIHHLLNLVGKMILNLYFMLDLMEIMISNFSTLGANPLVLILVALRYQV